MENTLENPLAFFDTYFREGIYSARKELKKDLFENLMYIQENVIEETNDYIKVENVYHQDDIPAKHLIFTLKSFIKEEIDKKVEHSKRLIEQNVQKYFSENLNAKGYLEFLKHKIEAYKALKSYKHFSLIKSLVNDFEDFYKSYYPSYTSGLSANWSFEILADSDIQQQAKIETLFNSLTEEPKMIECTKEEFYSAFSGNEIEKGINWLVRGKNKAVSKPSLFYFINSLIDNNHLERSIINDLNKMVLYTFRDPNGDEFKNLRQSKNYFSKTPTLKLRIDNIIHSIE